MMTGLRKCSSTRYRSCSELKSSPQLHGNSNLRPFLMASCRMRMPSVYSRRTNSVFTTERRRSIRPLSTNWLRNSKSSMQCSNAQRTQYLMKSSSRSISSCFWINATSGSIIQNSAKCRGVLLFSARKVGPKVYILPKAMAPNSPSSCPLTVRAAILPKKSSL